jgi:hypothetical protein
MARLGRVIVEALVHHYGRDEVLRRMSHPFWFQSFGAVMGMDWHSSGITTSVLGALKRGLAPIQQELGLYVCGGRGRHSRQTPAELARVGDRTGLDGDALAKASRLVAKVDSAAIQDGYDLYLHGFIVSAEGRWCVIQQGMNEARREARRYHWLSENLTSFLDAPHSAIEGPPHGTILNLADTRAQSSRAASLDLLAQGPARIVGVLKRYRDPANTALDLFGDTFADASSVDAPHLRMPSHHDVRASDVQLRRLHGTLAAAAELAPTEFTDLLLTPGVGGRTIASLAFVAEVIHGAPARFSDPARFSLAHGGKDGHPFPVPLKIYDETLRVLKSAVVQAKLGNDETLQALRRLDREARVLEAVATGPAYEELIDAERARSAEWDGRSV